MTNLQQNFIAGEWLGGADEIANLNPSDLSDTIGMYAQASLRQDARRGEGLVNLEQVDVIVS